MKYFLIILLLFCFSLTGCGNDVSIDNQNQDNNYTASRTTSLDNTNETNNTINTENTTIPSTNNIDDSNTINSNNTNTETELSSFSTKIYTPDDEARQTNIKITCSKLNGTIVKSRRNFFIL